jgi:phosphoglycerate dehydrogenase-like enzyme
MEMTVLVSSHFQPQHLAVLRERFPEVRFVHLATDGEVPEEGRNARALLRAAMTKESLSRTLRSVPTIEWFHTSTAGFDWVMVPEIEARNLTVTRSAASYSIPIGEYVIGAMFLLAKRFPALLEAQRERAWTAPEPEEIGGKTVGIVGAGAIGGEVARHAKCLGMRVIGTKRTPAALPNYDRVLPPSDLALILQEADFVVLACPLTPETRHMLGEAEFRRMKPTAYLINVARGALVVESALVEALEQGWIAGACMDAFEQEPLPPDSPLWALDNLVITPHSSFRSPRNMERVLSEFMTNLERYLKGEPLENRLRDLTLGY